MREREHHLIILCNGVWGRRESLTWLQYSDTPSNTTVIDTCEYMMSNSNQNNIDDDDADHNILSIDDDSLSLFSFA